MYRISQEQKEQIFRNWIAEQNSKIEILSLIHISWAFRSDCLGHFVNLC